MDNLPNTAPPGAVAESDETRVIEGNHYFPAESLNAEHFRDSDHHTTCFWKGVASYKHITVDGSVNENAAWYYPAPSAAASHVKDRIAFWRGVVVE